MSALEKLSLGEVLRWVGTPDTIASWIVSASLWATVLFTGSLAVGSSVGQPSVGISVGIFLAGVAVLVMTDQMWRRLEISV